MAKRNRKNNNLQIEKGSKKSQPQPQNNEKNEGKVFFSKRLIILCGAETEENYFKGLQNMESLKNNNVRVFCEVSKKSENEKFGEPINLITTFLKVLQNDETKNSKEWTELEQYTTQTNQNGKLLYVQNTVTKIEQELSKFKKQKTKILDKNSDFLWVVFDNDDNEGTKQKEFERLFALAKKYNINIAYSVRQFENWILLHFERMKRPFYVSECKNCLEGEEQKPKSCKECRCGLSDFSAVSCANGKDCKGEICIAGYLREKKYHPFYKKGQWKNESEKSSKASVRFCFEGLFEDSNFQKEKIVIDKMKNAIENAHWLRHQKNEFLAPAVTNPFVDVDKLVSEIIDYQVYHNEYQGLRFDILDKNSLHNGKLKLQIINNSKFDVLINQPNLSRFLLVKILPNYSRNIITAKNIQPWSIVLERNIPQEIAIDFGQDITLFSSFLYQFSPNQHILIDL